MTNKKEVESYIDNADEKARPTLEKLREIIISTIPEAEEEISYNVPFYKFHGTHVGFSAAKSHATFGIGADVLQSEDRKMLEEKGYTTGKETIQIKYDQKVPTEEIEQLLKAKVKMAEENSSD